MTADPVERQPDERRHARRSLARAAGEKEDRVRSILVAERRQDDDGQRDATAGARLAVLVHRQRAAERVRRRLVTAAGMQAGKAGRRRRRAGREDQRGRERRGGGNRAAGERPRRIGPELPRAWVPEQTALMIAAPSEPTGGAGRATATVPATVSSKGRAWLRYNTREPGAAAASSFAPG